VPRAIKDSARSRTKPRTKPVSMTRTALINNIVNAGRKPSNVTVFDNLPNDIMLKIYRNKHELEFYPCLEMINKFTHLKPEGTLKSNIPLKKLLSPVTNRKLFHVDVEQYEGDIEFKADKEKLKELEEKHNIKIILRKPNDPLHYYDYSDKYTDIRIKWKNNSKASMLDVICITSSIITFSIEGYVLNGFKVEDLNRKKDDITLIFVIV